MKKYIFIGLLVAFIAFLFVIYPIGKSSLSVLAGYSAKSACSCVFVADRELENVLEQELSAFGSIIDVSVDQDKKKVHASAVGIERTAIYREGLGCTILPPDMDEAFSLEGFQPASLLSEDPDTLQWPYGDMDTLGYPVEVNKQKLEAAIDKIFTESDPELLQNTRAALVVYKDKIVGERYSDGFDKNSRLRGWSMTKSVTSAFIGILVGEGKLNIMERAPIPEWQGQNDPRGEILLDHLLRMSSGLDFQEEYDGDTDANRMLFTVASTADFAIKSKLAHKPDTHWSYSSGTSNIISKIVRDQFEDHHEYLRFPREALFNKIAMRSAVIEPDASGTFVGSSFMYATARDWARFGLLYLYDGVWADERILPEGWVDYSRKRTPTTEYGLYSAQFWNAATKPLDTPMARYWEGLPEDIYYASGFEGQQVVIIPSKDIVIVRLGLTFDRRAWNLGAFIKDVLGAVKE
ncbi:MAG: serine hydrolase [Bacteroidota bacterium]